MRWDEDFGLSNPFEDREPQTPQVPAPPTDGGGYGGVIPDPNDVQPPEEAFDYGTFELPPYSGAGMPNIDYGPAPTFNFEQFMAPSFEQAQNEPGYQFRLDSGRRALERSAAAKGTLNTGTTLRDFIEYGQNFGAQEYSNVFNRALQSYMQYYRGAYDRHASQMNEWQSRFGANRDAALAGFQQQYSAWADLMRAQLERERLAMEASRTPPPSPPDVSAY